jgi:hypothetical protein
VRLGLTEDGRLAELFVLGYRLGVEVPDLEDVKRYAPVPNLSASSLHDIIASPDLTSGPSSPSIVDTIPTLACTLAVMYEDLRKGSWKRATNQPPALIICIELDRLV